jgi:polyisoprenoid-binding protein YceI
VLDALHRVGCRFWVEGGWGVDALVGRQTRPHRDLDIDIDADRQIPMAQDDFDPATTVLDDIAGDYTLDAAHTRLGFSARRAMVETVRGQFTEFSGTAHVDTANPAASKVEVRINANSIDTGNAQRNGHLLSGDFFETEQFPEITFISTGVERDGDTWNITGDLTIKHISHPVTVPFELTGSAKDPFGNIRVGFEGATTILRKDWGLNWNAALETGGVLVSDKIKLVIDVSAIQASGEAAPEVTTVEGEPTEASTTATETSGDVDTTTTATADPSHS